MKKLAFLILSVFILSLFTTSCSNDENNGSKEVVLYFSNSNYDSLTKESINYNKEEYKDETKEIKFVLENLLQGPKDTQNKAVIKDKVYLKGISFSKNEYGVLNVDLGGNFYYYPTEDKAVSKELLARYSIISTLCQFDTVSKVKIYINGDDLKQNFGKGDVVRAMGKGDVMLNSASSVETKTEKFVTLYFADKSFKKLLTETRKATMTDNSLEKTIVTELLRGPVSNKLERLVGDGAKLISIETANEVCFVNFSSAFLDGVESGSLKEKLLVYSVVNSLSQVAGVEKVQILIDGKKPEQDENQLFSAPLEEEKSIEK